MSLPVLQEFRCLDGSPSRFHDQLSGILYGQEYWQCVPNLQGNGLVWLVEYLDKVCCHTPVPRSPFKLVQALNGLDPSSPGFQQCLHELRDICGTGGILPTSYTLSSSHLNIDPEPFVSGGYGDMYEGTLDGSRVCIKRVRVYVKDSRQKGAKVCSDSVTFLVHNRQ